MNLISKFVMVDLKIPSGDVQVLLNVCHFHHPKCFVCFSQSCKLGNYDSTSKTMDSPQVHNKKLPFCILFETVLKWLLGFFCTRLSIFFNIWNIWLSCIVEQLDETYNCLPYIDVDHRVNLCCAEFWIYRCRERHERPKVVLWNQSQMTPRFWIWHFSFMLTFLLVNFQVFYRMSAQIYIFPHSYLGKNTNLEFYYSQNKLF